MHLGSVDRSFVQMRKKTGSVNEPGTVKMPLIETNSLFQMTVNGKCCQIICEFRTKLRHRPARWCDPIPEGSLQTVHKLCINGVQTVYIALAFSYLL